MEGGEGSRHMEEPKRIGSAVIKADVDTSDAMLKLDELFRAMDERSLKPYVREIAREEAERVFAEKMEELAAAPAL